jgi:hypothetical protein
MKSAILKQLSVYAKRIVHPLRRRFYVIDYVKPEEGIVRSWGDYLPEKTVGQSTAIRNIRVLAPEQRINIGSPHEDAFVPVGKLYREGSFVRPSIIVCDVPDARLHVGSGMVCTRDWEVVTDLDRRLSGFSKFRRPKPRQIKRLAGTYSTVFGWSADNVSHWMMDCLPRIHSLAQIEPKARVTLLMPESLSPVHRESLNCLLPPNFVVEYWPDDTWLQPENFLWASMVSGRWNAVSDPVAVRHFSASQQDRANLYPPPPGAEPACFKRRRSLPLSGNLWIRSSRLGRPLFSPASGAVLQGGHYCRTAWRGTCLDALR